MMGGTADDICRGAQEFGVRIPMMKMITVLAIVQIGLLVLLFSKIDAVEKRAPEAEYQSESASPTDDFSSAQPGGHSGDTDFYLNEDRLRQVIR